MGATKDPVKPAPAVNPAHAPPTSAAVPTTALFTSSPLSNLPFKVRPASNDCTIGPLAPFAFPNNLPAGLLPALVNKFEPLLTACFHQGNFVGLVKSPLAF